MQLPYAIIAIDISCEWTDQPPRYRVFVNDELFVERTFVWNTEKYLEETLNIQGPAGKYQIRCENVDPELGEFRFKNTRLLRGTGSLYKNTLELGQ